MNIIEAIDDPALLGRAIKNPSTFHAWRVALKALFGITMTDDEEDVYRQCTGRSEPPTGAFATMWLICGRRGGKSFCMALIAAYMALFKDWRRFLSPGERAVVLIVAADREQAKVVRRYVGGILANPMFSKHVTGETADSIELVNSVVIEIATCSFRTVRGRSVCVALLDEVAFWRSEATANPDREVWRAIKASMATFGDDGVAIIGSSPYARSGLLYDAYKRHFGEDGARDLVWQGATKTMNPTISDEFLAQEFEADPASAESEYNATFRNDIDAFITDDIVRPAILHGVFEIAPRDDVKYHGFVDAASGSGGDSMTMAISFKEGFDSVLACVVERRPPFDPEAVTQEFAETLKRYAIGKVTGDKWAAGFVETAFRRHEITYESSAAPKSDLYKELTPLLNAGRIKLLDNKRLIAQLLALERRTARGGRDSIDHPPRGHDDCINAACGALVMAAKPVAKPMTFVTPFVHMGSTGLKPGIAIGPEYQ